MGCIYVFTEDYWQHFSDATKGCFGGLDCLVLDNDVWAAKKLASIAEDVVDADAITLEIKFADFLSENEYIYLDAFIRICLEEYR